MGVLEEWREQCCVGGGRTVEGVMEGGRGGAGGRDREE